MGKLLVLGASLGCLSPALTIAACLSYKSPFSAPFDQQDAAMRAKQAFAASGMRHNILCFILRVHIGGYVVVSARPSRPQPVLHTVSTASGIDHGKHDTLFLPTMASCGPSATTLLQSILTAPSWL